MCMLYDGFSDQRAQVEKLYGAYDEKPLSNDEGTVLPDYEESTPAGKYLFKNPRVCLCNIIGWLCYVVASIWYNLMEFLFIENH